jgi:outer membrane protein assembly factor BamB
VWEDLLLATASPLDIPLADRHGQTQLPENMQPIIDQGAQWQYLAGARVNDAWTEADFSVEDWKTSAAGFGSEDNGSNTTVLRNMVGRYSVVYIRKSFNVPEPDDIDGLGLVINYNDAFIAYLNGEEILRVGVTSGRGARASRARRRGTTGPEYFKIDNPVSFLRRGTNVLAIEGHNERVTSRGFVLDPYLVAVPERSAGAQKKIATVRLDNVTGVNANADYASGSKMLLAMDRHTGEILWERGAKYSFRHNAIAAAAGKVFCIDGVSDAKLAYFKRRGLNTEKERSVYALEARTGQLLWDANEKIFGTWLAYSTEHGVLLEAGSRSGDRAPDEADRGMTAYRGTDGKVLWANDDSYKGPPILYHDRVITQTGGGSGSAAAEAKVYDLLSGRTVTRQHPMTGQTIPWTWVRFKGCNTAIASEHLLTFRSASGAFVDLTAGQGTASIGGFKSGCTSNLIIANGVLNAPDYTRTCVCSYQNQASLALVHMPEVAYWTFDYYMLPSEPSPVRQIGINFGAPGNRTADNGTLWLEFPPVRAKYQDPKSFRHHGSAVEGPYNWITASGVAGLREVRVRMFIQPGENPSSVDAFDKHIEQIPTFSEAQIKGAFETPRPYTVRLYFAETEPYELGRRVFDVSLQDRRVLEGFDIAKEAGGTNRTVIREFKGIDIKDDLKVALARAAQSRAEPLLCGIEIIAEGW